MNYYNEHDPFAAAWLRQLIHAGLIPAGVVDERSIEDVLPNELDGYTQCHFFAGIGGWSRALQLAWIPSTTRIWTGSCPCQPFSTAGKGEGFADERHLWPAFHHLIRVCRPPVVVGEQVASADGLRWCDLVQDDLEMEGYAFGKADLCAAGVGSPHIRQRLYWVAHTAGSQEHEELQGSTEAQGGGCSDLPCGCSVAGGLAHPVVQGLEGHGGHGDNGDQSGRLGADAAGSVAESSAVGGLENVGWTSPLHGFWRDADWLFCRDGKWRPVEPGLKPLAHGISARMGRLRGYGNAIVPQVAAEFLKAALLT